MRLDYFKCQGVHFTRLSKVGWGLILSLAWPTVVNLVVGFNSGLQWGISQKYSFFVSSE